MTNHFTRRQLAAALGLAAPAHWGAIAAWAFAPGEFWDEKSPADWSDKDIQKLMTKSPWAKQVTASMDMSAMAGRMGGGGGGGRRGGGMGGGGGMPGGGMGGGGMGGGGGMEGGGGGMPGGGMPGGGGMGGPGGGGGMGGPPEIKALVRWETAAPVREAAKRQPSADTAGHYVISMSGVPMMGGGGRPGQNQAPEATPDPAARQAAMEERRKALVERLKTSTMLQRKGKDPIHPDRVEVAAERRIYLFFFPHGSDPIQAKDKEVTFLARMGPIEVKTKFNLKDMAYKGELAL